MRRTLSGTVFVAGMVLAVSAQAGDAVQDVAAGERIARLVCSSCHDVGRTEGAPRNGAPSFSAIARERNAASIAMAIKAPMHKMPSPELGQEDVRQVTAYILSLRK